MLERTLNKDDKNGNYLARNLNVILQVAYTVTNVTIMLRSIP